MSDPTLGHSFLAAAGELGMCSAAWLFARTLGDDGGPAMVDDCAEVPSEDGPVPEDVAALAGADVPEGALPAALVDDAATLPEDDVVSG